MILTTIFFSGSKLPWCLYVSYHARGVYIVIYLHISGWGMFSMKKIPISKLSGVFVPKLSHMWCIYYRPIYTKVTRYVSITIFPGQNYRGVCTQVIRSAVYKLPCHLQESYP
ncbi:hypothetical protein VPH35_025210 [Triticum aestivum]